MNNTIDLCCRWDEQISDGVLKYKLINIHGKLQDVVREAFGNWNKQLVKLQLVEVSSKQSDQKAEIVISVGDIPNSNPNQLAKNTEAGLTAGQSVNNLDKDGFITNATILLSNELPNTGSDSNPLLGVISHEIGHALGLGHANFDDLMDPVVTGDTEEVSICDVKGVVYTNELSLEEEVMSTFHANLDKGSFISCQ
jgi:predicted Zn-dependent protease